jgi:alpha-amylase
MVTNICLCIDIHIPAIPLNYRFFDINYRHEYFDEEQVKNHVNKVYNENIWPFFETFKRIFYRSEGRLKIAVALSGITLILMYKYIPKGIQMFSEMHRAGCIEFLTEPWSHAILPFVDQKALDQQIRLHDDEMVSAFGKSPGIFLAYSSTPSPHLVNTVFSSGKKAVFAYANPFGRQFINTRERSTHFSKKGIFLINYFYSRLLKEIDFRILRQPEENISIAVAKKIRKLDPQMNPLIMVYQPAAANRPFHLNRAKIWEEVILQLLADSDILFKLPSELINNYNHFIPGNLEHPNAFRQFVLPDFWLKNSLQKEAFSKQLHIQTLIRSVTTNGLLNDWNLLLDMEYLFYMNTHFTDKNFAESHFNPFPSPYLAYINYMNVLDDMEGRLQKRKIVIRVSTRKPV